MTLLLTFALRFRFITQFVLLMAKKHIKCRFYLFVLLFFVSFSVLFAFLWAHLFKCNVEYLLNKSSIFPFFSTWIEQKNAWWKIFAPILLHVPTLNYSIVILLENDMNCISLKSLNFTTIYATIDHILHRTPNCTQFSLCSAHWSPREVVF